MTELLRSTRRDEVIVRWILLRKATGKVGEDKVAVQTETKAEVHWCDPYQHGKW